jgi:predicted kinase
MPRFVVVTGLPGSGKSTIGRQLSTALMLPLLDKDDILEGLFDQSGIGDGAHRGALSREADRELARRTLYLPGAVLVSWWRHPASRIETGTPTGWLSSLKAPLVEIHCCCRPEVACERFFARTRHPGHLDQTRDRGEELARFRLFAAWGPIGLGPVVEVDTELPLEAGRLIHAIAKA